MNNLDKFLELSNTSHRGLRLMVRIVDQHPGYFIPVRFYMVGIIMTNAEELDNAVLLNISKTWYPVTCSTNLGDAFICLEKKLSHLHYGNWNRTLALIFNALITASKNSVDWVAFNPSIESAMHCNDLSNFFEETIRIAKEKLNHRLPRCNDTE